MKISTHWLRDYVTFELTPDDLAHRLTMVGLEVEEIIRPQAAFSGVVVGQILEVSPHPSADKLKLCKVDISTETISLVCGAPNVAEGQIVPVACVGAVLGELTIEARTLRGVESHGMICSERELGISDNHEGILVLDGKDFKPGDQFHTNGNEDIVFDVSVTPNRPDCLSHLGVARELSVIMDSEFNKPEPVFTESGEKVDDHIVVEIDDPDACPRYSARVVRNVKIGPSPKWLAERLEAVGVRSINNVVDVTNYILMETGHPLHGFDYDFVQGHKIVVRKAKEGEEFVTLDDATHTLSSDDLLICDGERPVALAGVMGGLNSEVTDDTKHILLESAYFDPMTVRKTAKRLGMSTEASQRFERGADPNGTLYAINRAAQLLADLADGEVAQGVADAHPKPTEQWSVKLRSQRIAAVLGADVPHDTVIDILNKLGLDVTDDEPFEVRIPTFRPDLQKEIDLIEEIVRHYGYDHIEPKLNSNVALSFLPSDQVGYVESLKDILVGIGFIETLTNSMVSEKNIKTFTPDVTPVEIQNPLSPDTRYMRTNLIGSLLDSVRWNRNRSEPNLKLFEIGKVFEFKGAQLPEETLTVAGAITGNERSRPFWGVESVAVDYFHLKGVLESLQSRLHLPQLELKSNDHIVLQTDQSLDVFSGGKLIGNAGSVKRSILEIWDIDVPVFVFSLSVKALLDASATELKYKPIPKFPAVKRDLAVIIDNNVAVSDILATITDEGGKNLRSTEVFDLYTGKQIPAGKKSVAFSLTFLSSERTLTEKEIDPIMSTVMKKLEKRFSASLRS